MTSEDAVKELLRRWAENNELYEKVNGKKVFAKGFLEALEEKLGYSPKDFTEIIAQDILDLEKSHSIKILHLRRAARFVENLREMAVSESERIKNGHQDGPVQDGQDQADQAKKIIEGIKSSLTEEEIFFLQIWKLQGLPMVSQDSDTDTDQTSQGKECIMHGSQHNEYGRLPNDDTTIFDYMESKGAVGGVWGSMNPSDVEDEMSSHPGIAFVVHETGETDGVSKISRTWFKNLFFKALSEGKSVYDAFVSAKLAMIDGTSSVAYKHFVIVVNKNKHANKWCDIFERTFDEKKKLLENSEL